MVPIDNYKYTMESKIGTVITWMYFPSFIIPTMIIVQRYLYKQVVKRHRATQQKLLNFVYAFLFNITIKVEDENYGKDFFSPLFNKGENFLSTYMCAGEIRRRQIDENVARIRIKVELFSFLNRVTKYQGGHPFYQPPSQIYLDHSIFEYETIFNFDTKFNYL